MYPISVCILACAQHYSISRLIDSVRDLKGLEVEVVIGDNSPLKPQQDAMRELADVYVSISDRELWFDGFGPTKTKIVDNASNPWVMIADPDEVWITRNDDHLELLDAAVNGDAPKVFRTTLVEHGRHVAEHGRVYHRRDWRLMGMIHEELHSRRGRQNWSVIASMKPFANVRHFNGERGPGYMRRKGVLYDNLLHRAHLNPELSLGTRNWWLREYWPLRLAEGWEPTSFEEWTTQYKEF